MQQQTEPRWSVWFTRLALLTALLTIGLIVFGAVVRVTDSGLGCGNSWPLCEGTVLPPLDNLTAWIEWLHRLFAALIGVLGLATLLAAWQSQRQHRLIFGAVVVAALLFVLQVSLGAIVVWLDLPRTTVALHLGTAMLLLAALLVAVVAKLYSARQIEGQDQVSILVYATAALSFVVIVSGALVRGRAATLACTDWPLCNGALFPLAQGEPQMVHMLHRYVVVGLGIALMLLGWQVLKNRDNLYTRLFAGLALLAYGAQAGIGAMFVLSAAAPFWGAAHVGFAATTWALLVCLAVMEYLDRQAVLKTAMDTV